MVHAVKRLLEVQEEDPTHNSIFDVIINTVEEIYKTSEGGVPLPKLRLCLIKDVWKVHIWVYLFMDDPFQDFAKNR